MRTSPVQPEISLLTAVGLLMSDDELIGFARSVSDELEAPEDAMETIVEHMLASSVGWRHGALFLDRALPSRLCTWLDLGVGELLNRTSQLTCVSEQGGLLWLLLRKRMLVLEPIISKLTRRAQNRTLRDATRDRASSDHQPLFTQRAAHATH